MSQSPISPIESAARSQNVIFAAYILILLAGAALTFLLYRAGNKVQEAIKADADARIAEANKASGEANKEAGKANERAGNLEVEAEALRKENLKLSLQVEEEKTARLKIEERMAPRRLTAQQKGNVVGKLRRFPSPKLNLVASTNEKETVDIANDIIECLNNAKWPFGTLIGQDMARAVSGILIEVERDADEPTRNAAQGLAEALRAENLAVDGPLPPAPQRLTGAFTGERLPDAKIWLTIGKK